jgi:hypothetical protein
MPPAHLLRLGQGYGCLDLLELAADAWIVRGLNITTGIRRRGKE